MKKKTRRRYRKIQNSVRVSASGDASGSCSMFRLADGALLGRWQAHLGARALAVTFAGGYVFTGGSDGSVARRRVDGADDDCEQLHPKHDGAVRSFAHRTGILCSAAVDGTVRVWDLRPNEDAPPNVLYGFSGSFSSFPRGTASLFSKSLDTCASL